MINKLLYMCIKKHNKTKGKLMEELEDNADIRVSIPTHTVDVEIEELGEFLLCEQHNSRVVNIPLPKGDWQLLGTHGNFAYLKEVK